MKFGKEICESLTLKFGKLARELKLQGEDVISMTIGEPNFKTPQYIEDAVVKALKDGYTKYSDSLGLLELRKLIINDINNNHNTSYKEDNVIVTPGVKSGLHLALSAILKPGDEVIVMSPYYLSYPPLIKIAEYDTKIIDVPFLEGGSVNKDLLEKSITKNTKCILINTPSNPTGKILSLDEVNFIASVAKRENIYIVSDEIYDKLILSDNKFYSFLNKELDNLLIYANGYSKAYSMTGYRIGYVVAPKDIINLMLLLQQNINTNTNTFVQKGVCSVYQNPLTHLNSYLKDLNYRVELFTAFINNSKLFKGYKPEAGFFYFVDISKTNLTSEEFTLKLINDAKIVVTPGIGFGEKFDNHVRFSLSVSNEELIKAIKRLKEFEKNFI